MQYSPQFPSPELKSFARTVWTLYFALFASVGMYWPMLKLLPGPEEPLELGGLKNVVRLLGVGLTAAVLYLRLSRLPPLLADASLELAQRLARLRFTYLLCYTLSETVGILGFILGFLGLSQAEAVPFFLASVALFLLCYPRIPETPGSRGV